MSILLQITLVLVIALLMVPLSKRLRLPSVLGYLLTGIILSPGLLHLIQAPEVMRSFMQVSAHVLDRPATKTTTHPPDPPHPMDDGNFTGTDQRADFQFDGMDLFAARSAC